jgi:hypothetical protein
MSALLQSPNLFRSLRGVNEQEAIITISRVALTAADATSGLEALSSVALRLSGLHGVEVSLRAGQGTVEVLGWHDSKAPEPRGAATGLIAANSREWGRLRILFEPHMKSVECPLRFARVLAQHVALMLNRLELLIQNKASNAAVRRLEHRLDTRKAVSRASGILAEAKNLTRERALLLLLRQARETRRSPLALARTMIRSEDFTSATLRSFR